MKEVSATSENPVNIKRLLLFTGLFIGLSSLGFYVVYQQFAEQPLSFDSRLLQPWVLLSLLALLVVYYLSDALRLHYTLRALGYNLPLTDIAKLVFINLFFSNVTPMATGGGFAQVWYLQRKGVAIGTATTATTVRTVLAVIAIFTATPLLLFNMSALQELDIASKIGLYVAIFSAIYLLFFAIVLLRTHWLISPLHWCIGGMRRVGLLGIKRHRRWHFACKRETLRFARGFRDYWRGDKRFIFASMLFTLIFLVSLFSFPAILLWALDYAVNYGVVLGLLTVTTFVMYFSPTPGASGFAEGVFGHIFAPITGSAHLLLVTLCWRFITIYLGMIIGIFVTQQELTVGKKQSLGERS
ncbi:lysylphosphatidylglycerol synthase transmembrane domain-containing protein [Idiomarina xiamenensis]|uniref:Integral membrane protein n=1 Tax=Idiomarina xiamenensis 10-D-4 TaxID=740709 RepID=K2JMR7_9GAMM|nr:lysylphosphatidylglycerol synthase transmembrane domain-containing protein [Idiomarina xiamenensis]EKE84821.1 integral membrane protein [Idiomarina xiamenensis 10-D-4]